LSEPGIEGHYSIAEGQTQFFRDLLQAQPHGIHVPPASSKKFFQGKPFLGYFWVEGKGPPLGFNFIIPAQPLNTPGTEIAPGSDVI
jgi:hypothetical protein